jgi:hypothetical protein
MTKQDLFDWCISHGCKIVPMPNSTIGSVMIRHDENEKQIASDVRGMDKPVSDNYVCLICTRLGIQIPNYGKSAEDLINKLSDI